jgi:hypothetical protein
MKNALLAALLIVPLSSQQAQTAPASKEAPSVHDQVKTDQAKSKADFESGPKERPWDRDANGKRPWERKEAPLPKKAE